MSFPPLEGEGHGEGERRGLIYQTRLIPLSLRAFSFSVIARSEAMRQSQSPYVIPAQAGIYPSVITFEKSAAISFLKTESSNHKYQLRIPRRTYQYLANKRTPHPTTRNHYPRLAGMGKRGIIITIK
jgi:hypothetical protein